MIFLQMKYKPYLSMFRLKKCLCVLLVALNQLAKKKPEAAVSKSKLVIANRLLQRVREALADEESIEFLDLLNEDDVPQVSDVTLILSQYVAAMTAFKAKYHGWNGEDHVWFLK